MFVIYSDWLWLLQLSLGRTSTACSFEGGLVVGSGLSKIVLGGFGLSQFAQLGGSGQQGTGSPISSHHQAEDARLTWDTDIDTRVLHVCLTIIKSTLAYMKSDISYGLFMPGPVCQIPPTHFQTPSMATILCRSRMRPRLVECNTRLSTKCSPRSMQNILASTRWWDLSWGHF